MEIIDNLNREFESRFTKVGKLFFCPGRVNIIGEHIDYNGGLVLPAAISLGIYAIAAPNNQAKFRIYSLDFPEAEISFNLTDIDLKNELNGNWGSYVAGTLLAISKQLAIPIPPFDIVFAGNLPKGSGLSSSAALEVLSGFVGSFYAGKEINRRELALLCQKTENEFIGVNCGIMDQFAVANGKANSAMLLDCSLVKCSYVPIALNAYALVIMNTNKPRRLVESKYNERRLECEAALKAINRNNNYTNLCQAKEGDLALITDDIIRKRALHVVSENNRVLQAAEALRLGDVVKLGQILKASHQSLKENYEVSGIELDTLCEAANNNEACIGARMTGAGFGGCAIALVHKSSIIEFVSSVSKIYAANTNLAASFYECELVDGVKMLA